MADPGTNMLKVGCCSQELPYWCGRCGEDITRRELWCAKTEYSTASVAPARHKTITIPSMILREVDMEDVQS